MALDDFVRKQIDVVCAGWSGIKHWTFQQEILTKMPHLCNICMLGVYLGRDTAYMAVHLEHLRPGGHHITAVDLFSDAPCADWAPEKRGLTWEQAGFGPAPAMEAVRKNLSLLGLDAHVTLVKQDACSFLRSTGQIFDLIFIDTSHDYETTRDTIRAALPRLSDAGVLAGDDYSDEGTWGVKRAVSELCPRHSVFMEWIWYAPKSLFTAPTDRPSLREER